MQGVAYSVFDDPKKGKDALRIRTFIEDHKVRWPRRRDWPSRGTAGTCVEVARARPG